MYDADMHFAVFDPLKTSRNVPMTCGLPRWQANTLKDDAPDNAATQAESRAYTRHAQRRRESCGTSRVSLVSRRRKEDLHSFWCFPRDLCSARREEERGKLDQSGGEEGES